MPNIGPLEIIIVLIIVLVIFGPKRLPELGSSLGRGMREFKDSVTGNSSDSKTHQVEGTASEETLGSDNTPASDHEKNTPTQV